MFKIYTQPNCVWCERAKNLITEKGDKFYTIDITDPEGFKEYRKDYPTAKTVPQIIYYYSDLDWNGNEQSDDIGGFTDLMQWYGINGTSPIR